MALPTEDTLAKSDYAPGNDTIRGEYNEASSAPDYASGPDFGEADPYGAPVSNTIEPAARELDGSTLATDGNGIRPFENLDELPADLQSALDELKIAVLRHKATNWQEVEVGQVTGHLYALIQMVELPSEQSHVSEATVESQKEEPPELTPEDDIAPF